MPGKSKVFRPLLILFALLLTNDDKLKITLCRLKEHFRAEIASNKRTKLQKVEKDLQAEKTEKLLEQEKKKALELQKEQ